MLEELILVTKNNINEGSDGFIFRSNYLSNNFL